MIKRVDDLAHMRLIGPRHRRDLRRQIPLLEASTMIARCRLDWYLALREICFNREPSSSESPRTNTSGGRI